MPAIVRGFVTLIVVATLLATGVVWAAHARTERFRRAAETRQREHLHQAIQHLSRGQFRRAAMAVEQQVIGNDGDVRETQLLWQGFTTDADGKRQALPPQRVTLPGDDIRVETLVLTFDATQPEIDAPIRGKSVVIFSSLSTDAPEKVYRFCHKRKMPMALRANPLEPNELETQWWERLWANMENKNQRTTWPRGQWQFTKHPSVEVRPGLLYEIIATSDGHVTVHPTESSEAVRQFLEQAVHAAN